MDKSCCDDQDHDCLQSDACPIYQQRRRVRAGQPAPILLDPEDFAKDDELPSWLAILIVIALMLIVAALAAGWVAVL